ncbi:MAG: type II secretion system secretin GspD [Halioglobus sp.]
MHALNKLFPVVVTSLLLLTSCTAMEPREQPVPQATDVSASPPTGAPLPTSVESANLLAEQAPEQLPAHETSEPTIYRGTDEVFRRPAAKPSVRLLGDAVSLNFEEAPLTEVVHAIMGEILELDYVVEHPINGQVTLRTRSPIPRDQLLDVLESLLTANQAYLVRDGNGRFFVSGSAEMRRLRPGVAGSAAEAVGFSTIIVPLQYISAKNMAEILAPVATDEAFVRIDNLRNVLMLAGTRSQLEGWQEIITTFDVDLLKGMSVGIYPIENSSIEDVEAALAQLMGKSGGEGEADGIAGIGSMVRIIPVERLSSLLVVTPRAHYLSRIGTWIKRLDQEPDAYFERRLYVYPVQNTNAVHLADMLSTIFSGADGSGRRSGGGGVAPGFTPETVSSSGENAIGGAAPRNTADASRNFNLGDVRVVADEENNALLLYATGKEYRKIQPALERLDIAATQVIIEASIIEVTLTDEMRYGLEWSFNGDLGGSYEGVGQLVNGVSIGAQVPGFSYSVINGSGQIKAVLNALASDNLLNVISSPSVMVLDNQTATIQVGDQVPVSSGTAQTGDVVTTQVEYRDTGVKLSVTPSVNAGGMVTMDVEQSVTDVGPVDDAGAGQRTFLERTITSKVAVRSSQSVVLGGLIRENKSEGSSGIPGLHRLPILGPLFGTRTVDGTRTELLVVITPRVISNESDLREVSDEMRRQMRGLDLIDVSESSSFLIERDAESER